MPAGGSHLSTPHTARQSIRVTEDSATIVRDCRGTCSGKLHLSSRSENKGPNKKHGWSGCVRQSHTDSSGYFPVTGQNVDMLHLCALQ